MACMAWLECLRLVGLVALIWTGNNLAASLSEMMLLTATEKTSHYSGRRGGVAMDNSLILPYHKGPILSDESGIAVYIIWYGTFNESQRAAIVDFFASFDEDEAQAQLLPSVSSWWGTTKSYKDVKGSPVTSTVKLAGEISDNYTKGTSITKDDLKELVLKSLTTFKADSKAVYFVLTAENVHIDSFCRNSCGSHYVTNQLEETEFKQLLYSWVGNAASQCPGYCAWPYAKPVYGPPIQPLVAPNGDVGVDGMIINIATLLAGIATNPYTNAYYQGHPLAPLEAATACIGNFGAGAFPGYPGDLLFDQVTRASYNAVGSNGRKYLLPALWDPLTLSCKTTFTPQIPIELEREVVLFQ